MNSGYEFWKKETPPVLTLAAFFASRLEEATGLPPGWVSNHGNKRVQKQADGEWIYVPQSTPLGVQPFYKKTSAAKVAAGAVGGKASNVDELMSYLKDAGFDDEKTRKTLLKNGNWVTNVLQKFGAGWYQKFLAKAKLDDAEAAAEKTPPEASPNTPPVVPVAAENPLDAALSKLGHAPDSPEAFVFAQLFKNPSSDKAVDAYAKKFGKKYGKAFHEVEALIASAKSKGVVTASGDFESGLTVSFVGGSSGPVMSAPVVAVSAPVSATEPAAEPPKVKRKKPAPVPYAAAPPAPAATPAPEPESEPKPYLHVQAAPTDPKTLELVAKLGFAPDSANAKILGIWRKHLKVNHLTAVAATRDEIAGLEGGLSSGETKALHNYVKDLVHNKVYKLPDWDAAEFMVDPEPPEAGDKAASQLYAMKPGLKKAIVGALGNLALTVTAQKAIGLLWAGAADAFHAEKVVVDQFGDDGKAVIQKLKAAGLYRVIQKTPDGELAGPPFESEFIVPGSAPVPYTGLPPSLPSVAVAPVAVPTPAPAPVPVAPPPPVVAKPQKAPEGLPATVPEPTSAKVLHWAGQLGYAPSSDEAKVLGLWHGHQASQTKQVGMGKTTPAKLTIADLVAAGWGQAKAEVFATTIIKKLLYADGFDLDDFTSDVLPEVPVSAPPPPPPPSAPVSIPVSVSAGGALPAIPAMSDLSPAGDAKSKLGGNKPKEFLKDSHGNLFLYKTGADAVRAFGGQVAASIAALVGGPETYVPVKAVGKKQDWGSVQPVVPDVMSDLSQLPLTNLSKKQLQQLLRERVLDWVVANHDSKAGNFVVRKNGDILGIDKEQALKFIGDDELSLDYKPNPSPPVYNALFAGYASKKIDLDPNDMLPTIQAVEGISDADWTNAVQPYINALPEDVREETLAKVLQRKHNVRKDFETFFTMLKKKRGEPGAFTFAGVAPVVTAPSKAIAAGVLVPPKMPSIASLTYAGKATDIGGAGEKHYFEDDAGKKFLLKLATNKSTGAPEPWKAASQTLFATIGQAVKPSTPPVGATTYNGKPATLQPWLGDNIKSLAGMTPASLTAAQKKDVADEHVLDWLLSQHDTHGANLLMLPSGSVVGIDKEQGFKYLLPNSQWQYSTPEGDVLSTSYHPNAQYGENPPYYNKFWADFADNKQNFDPTVMKDAIEAIEKIPDDQYLKALESYVSIAPGGAAKASALYDKALARKKNIRADFEQFITGLYEKRTKKKGKFTYAGGWFPEGGVVAAPASTAQALPPAPAPFVPPAPIAPKPVAGHVAPAPHEISKASAKLGVPSGGVYYPALKALAEYGSPDTAIAALTATGLSPEMAKKRVLYVHKKLKAAGGWAGVLAPEPVVVAPAVGTQPAGPKLAGKVVLFQSPLMSGPVGVVSPKLVTAGDVLMNTGTKSKTPEGFPEPSPGKMWESKPFSQFFAGPESGGFLYKAKSPKDKEGNKLTESPYLLLKLSKLSVPDAEAAFKAAGVTPLISDSSNPIEGIHNEKLFFDSGVHLCCIVKKAEWEAVKAKDPQIVLQVDIPAPVMVTTGKFTTTPAAGELAEADLPANGNLAELATLQDSKEIGYAKGFMGDGKSVEHLAIQVQRNEDEKGTFYRTTFKLREPVWTKLKGYTDGEFQFNRVKYDATSDAWKKVGPGKGGNDRYDARMWNSEGSQLSIGTGSSVFSTKGLVTADVRLKAGETLEAGLRRVLSAASPTLADDVLKPASKEDIELVGLSALYWSAAPQEADTLKESDRTIPELRSRLKALKFSDAELDSIRMEGVANGYVAPVLPGRGAKIAKKYPVSHVAVSGRGNVEAIVDQILGSTIGLVQRLLQGVPVDANTTSASSDLAGGGGDYVYGNVVYQNGAHTPSWGGGEVVMVYDASELDRLDAFIHIGDNYGTCNPKHGSYGSAYKNRGTIETAIPHHREILFRRGINSRKLLKVRIEDKTVAEQIISKLKQRGVTTINGMKPEDLVVMKGSDATFHNTYLKPAGY